MECFMHINKIEERKLTELDFARLNKLAATGTAPRLDEILGDAEVMPSPSIPADVVTMYAQFTVRDTTLQRPQTFVLCYPHDANAAFGFISVLSPAGMALLGLPVGAVATWAGPNGEANAVRIEEILFQPEASGDYVS
jgi:regulator of nucleoside diphosphate kinase